jgi:hypothetical protein
LFCWIGTINLGDIESESSDEEVEVEFIKSVPEKEEEEKEKEKERGFKTNKFWFRKKKSNNKIEEESKFVNQKWKGNK